MSAERSWNDLIEINSRQEFGEAWLPDREPDHPRTLVGTVRGYDQGPVSEFTGEQPWICTVEDRTGKLWSVWLNRAVLVSEFERQRPSPDERIVLRYRGQQDVAGRAAPAHLYTLTVDRDQQLPGFLARPRLEEGEERRPVDVPDAEVVEEPKREEEPDDDAIPF